MSGNTSCLRRVAAVLSFVFVAGAASAQLPDVDPNIGLRRLDSGGQLVDGHVRALALQSGSRVLVGGDFVQTAGGVARTDLLRLKRDGTLDPSFDVAVASSGATAINAIAVDGEFVYVGGRFETINGVPRRNIAKLTRDGVVVLGWSADLSGANDVVHAIAVGRDAVYAGGDFSAHDLWGVARLSATNGDIDPAWRAQTQVFVTPPGGTPNAASRGRVHSLIHTGTDLVVGGYFGEIAGRARASVARVSLTSPAAVGDYAGPALTGERVVYALELSADGNKLYFGGQYFSTGSLQNLIRSDARTGALDPNWWPQPNGPVRALERVGAYLYVGGQFSGVVPADHQNFVRVSTENSGSIDTSWRPKADTKLLALVADRPRARLYVGGEYRNIAGSRRDGLARFSGIVDPDVIFADSYELDAP